MTNISMELEEHTVSSAAGRNMHSPATSNDLRNNENEFFMEYSFCVHYLLGPNPFLARYVYTLIFLVTGLLAWTIRDYGRNALSELEKLRGCHGARYCLGAEGVLRISFGCFLFFFVMFVSTIGTKKVEDFRNSWHSEWWPAKIILWIGLMVIPFFIPSPFVQVYGKIARFGAGAFLLIQLISVISFIRWLNECCYSEKNAKRCRYQSMVFSAAVYVASIVGIVLMYVWYVPKSSCRLNLLFISITLVLIQLMAFVSVIPKVKAGFLSPALMGMYIVFLCWSGIRSEPHTEICNKKAEAATGADWLIIVSFVMAIVVIVMATFSTGIDSKCLQFKKPEAQAEGSIPYGYGFFHLVFAMGSMYFAMLLIGWDAHKTLPKWTIDVGWVSTWVRIVNEWVATLVYVWMQIAPLFWKRRQVVDSV